MRFRPKVFFETLSKPRLACRQWIPLLNGTRNLDLIKKHRIVILCYLLFLFPIVLVQFKFKEPSSQNASYHLQLAHLLQQNDWRYTSVPILENSQFSKQFVDQHFGFHFLVAFVNIYVPDAWAIKTLNIIVLSIMFFLLLLRIPVGEKFIATLVILFFLFYFFDSSFNRLFWERPQSLTLLSMAIVFVNFERFQKQPAWAFLVLLLAGLISFECVAVTIFVFFLSAVLLRNFKLVLYALLGAGAGLVLPFFDFSKFQYLYQIVTYNFSSPDVPGEWRSFKINSPARIVSFLILVPIFLIALKKRSKRNILLFLITVIFLLISLKSQRMHLFYMYSMLLLVLSLIEGFSDKLFSKKLVSRIFVVLLFLGNTFIIHQVHKNYRGDYVTAYYPEGFLNWFAKSEFSGEPIFNAKWEYWSANFYHNPQVITEPGFSTMIYSKNPLIVDLTEKIRKGNLSTTISDWRQVLKFFNSRLVLVETFHPLGKLIAQKKWPFVQVYGDFKFSVFEFLDPERYDEYERLKIQAQVCMAADTLQNIESCPPQNIKITSGPNKASLFFPISERNQNFQADTVALGLVSFYDSIKQKWILASDLYFGRTELSLFSSQGAKLKPFWYFPFQKKDKDWVLHERGQVSVDRETFLSDLTNVLTKNYLEEKSLFYELGKPTVLNESSRLRIFLGVYFLCMTERADAVLVCKNLLQSKEFELQENWSLGSKAVLGLALRKAKMLDNKEFANNVVKQVSSHFDSNLNSWRETSSSTSPQLTGRSYVFFVGEALSFLSAMRSRDEIPWLRSQIQSYEKLFYSSRDAFYVRWLSSVYYFSLVNNPSERLYILADIRRFLTSVQARFIYSEKLPKDFVGCYYDKAANPVVQNHDHRSGLLLEGLAHFGLDPEINSWPEYRKLVLELEVCVLRQQIRPENFIEMGATANQTGAVRMRPADPSIRIDVLSHLGIGLSLLKGNYP